MEFDSLEFEEEIFKEYLKLHPTMEQENSGAAKLAIEIARIASSVSAIAIAKYHETVTNQS